MNIIVNKLNNGTFCTTGFAFHFSSEQECIDEFSAMKLHQDIHGEFELALINNDIERVESFRISSELALEISGGKLK